MRGKAWAGVLGVAFMMLCGGMGLGCSETEGTDDIVGFPAGCFEDFITHCREQILEGLKLLCKLGGHTFSVSLISVIHFVAEGGGFDVKCYGNRIGLDLIGES